MGDPLALAAAFVPDPRVVSLSWRAAWMARDEGAQGAYLRGTVIPEAGPLIEWRADWSEPGPRRVPVNMTWRLLDD